MNKLYFTVDSALLRELGEKLVESVHLAVAELVKNAYDADATVVSVEFKQNDKGNPEIHISDDGVGMNFDEVKNYWMRIATTNKAENRISRVFGRPKTGAKGIGRFCCRRLGSKLMLITIGSFTDLSTGEIKFQQTSADFFWNQFKPGTDVTDIECPGEQSNVENRGTGTTLIISSLVDEWQPRGYNWLKRQLAVLAANRGARRPGYQDDPGFDILLEAPDFEGGGVRDIREDLIKGGWGTLTAHINTKKQAVCELNAMDIGRKTIISNQTYPELNDVSLKLGILVDARSQMRDTNIVSKGTLKEILPDWGGVQVRYHGFRVFPYGDDDWLKIDQERGLRKRIPVDELHAFAQKLQGVNPDRVLLNMLSMRNYVGDVEIGHNAKGFEMKANREGFIDSQAVKQLNYFVRFAIDWSTIYRDFFLRQRAREEAETARETLEELTGKEIKEENVIESAVHYIQKEIDHIAVFLPETEGKTLKKSVAQAIQVILKQDSSNHEELSHLRLIASTSTLLLIFSHEVKSLLGMLETGKNTMKIIEDKLPEKEQQMLQKIRVELEDLKGRFRELLEMTSMVGIDSKNEKPKQLALRERISKAKNVFRLIINKYDIKIDDENVPNNIVIKSILEAELYAILLNILSNSIKSVIAAGGERKIEISALRDNGKTIIQFKDSGLKLDPAYFEEVFVPFLADPEGELYERLNSNINPEDKYIVGTGSGLGLSIVKRIVEIREGQISFKNPTGDWRNELEIILP
jgi:signal transduction histidine kinase